MKNNAPLIRGQKLCIGKSCTKGADYSAQYGKIIQEIKSAKVGICL